MVSWAPHIRLGESNIIVIGYILITKISTIVVTTIIRRRWFMESETLSSLATSSLPTTAAVVISTPISMAMWFIESQACFMPF